MIRLAVAIFLSLCGVANAQLGGGLQFPGPGTPHTTATYQGPGDVVSGATAWGSCARAYNAAYANGTNPLCDLVDSAAPTVVICTLRVQTNGFVDLTGTYCTGSVTPSAKCAAATGAVCNISQVYDQTGNTNHWTQVTAASQPILTFASVNSLPVMTCNSSRTINTTAPFTATQFSLATVYERTSGTALGGAFGGAGNGAIGSGSVANNAMIQNGTTANVAGATDVAYHGLNAAQNNTASSGALNIDGTDNTGLNSNTLGLSGTALRFCRATANELLGNVAEGGFWSGTVFSSGQRTSLYNNMHGSSGYNGAF